MKENEELNKLIASFLSNKISGNDFEKEFTKIWDFTEIDSDILDYDYFIKIRSLLERFTEDYEDLSIHSEYYLSGKELHEAISQIKKV